MRRIGNIRPVVIWLAEVGAVAAAGALARVGWQAVVAAVALWTIAAITFCLFERRCWAHPRVRRIASLKAWAASSLAVWIAAALLPLEIAPALALLLPLVALAAGALVQTVWRAAAVRRPTPVVVVDEAHEQRLPGWLAYYWPEWQIVGLYDGKQAAAAEREATTQGALLTYYVNGQGSLAAASPQAVPLDDLLERVSGRVLVEHADTVVAPASPVALTAKRALDVCVAAGGLVLMSPLMAVLAGLIKLESKGPVIYRQRRLGRDRQSFEMLKFRSMVDQAEQHTGPVWARPDDPRCTLMGRLLRPLHLDELPQLVNVLRGEMSLVGPRPERPELADDLLEKLPVWGKRLAIKPGVTGWAQINQGYDRGLDDVRRKLEYDLFYVKRMGPLFDAAILLRTVDAVLFGKPRHSARPELP